MLDHLKEGAQLIDVQVSTQSSPYQNDTKNKFSLFEGKLQVCPGQAIGHSLEQQVSILAFKAPSSSGHGTSPCNFTFRIMCSTRGCVN
jgi:hypothetical protein